MTRKQQISKIQDKAMDLQFEVEALKEELEEALDNYPENLQYSERGEAMQNRIDLLDAWITELETIATEEVE